MRAIISDDSSAKILSGEMQKNKLILASKKVSTLNLEENRDMEGALLDGI